jgi:hypothetical protein
VVVVTYSVGREPGAKGAAVGEMARVVSGSRVEK